MSDSDDDVVFENGKTYTRTVTYVGEQVSVTPFREVKVMTDLEMTKLCAKAMGLRLIDDYADCVRPVQGILVFGVKGKYDPLRVGEQQMDMVKQFHLFLAYQPNMGQWLVRDINFSSEAYADDLGRAIVECVAKIEAQRTASVSDK